MLNRVKKSNITQAPISISSVAWTALGYGTLFVPIYNFSRKKFGPKVSAVIAALGSATFIATTAALLTSASLAAVASGIALLAISVVAFALTQHKLLKNNIDAIRNSGAPPAVKATAEAAVHITRLIGKVVSGIFMGLLTAALFGPLIVSCPPLGLLAAGAFWLAGTAVLSKVVGDTLGNIVAGVSRLLIGLSENTLGRLNIGGWTPTAPAAPGA